MGGRGAARHRRSAARPRPAVRSRAHRADHDDLGRRGLRRPLADRLDLVRARQRGASRCCAPAGSPGARRLRDRLSARPCARHARSGVRVPSRRSRASPSRRRSACSPSGSSPSWAALQPVRAAHAEDGAIAALSLGDYDRRSAQGARPQRGSTRCRSTRSGSWPTSQTPAATNAARKPSARAGGPSPARERRGVAATRPLPALGARRPEERACGVPDRVLPRPRRRCAPPLTCSRPRARSRPRASKTSSSGR